KGGGRLPALVAMLLDVGVARVIVDGDVQVDVADPAGPLAALCLGVHPPHPMPGEAKGRQLGGVDVDQRSGPRPLIAAARGLRLAAKPRETVAAKHLPDRRAGPADDPGQPPGAEVGLAAGAQDRFLLGGRQAPWLALRARAAVAKPRPR